MKMKTSCTCNVVKLTATQAKTFANRFLATGNKIPQPAVVLNIKYDLLYNNDDLILVPCKITVRQSVSVNMQVLELLQQLANAGIATPQQIEQMNKLEQGACGECACSYTIFNDYEELENASSEVYKFMCEVNGGATPYMVG